MKTYEKFKDTKKEQTIQWPKKIAKGQILTYKTLHRGFIAYLKTDMYIMY